MAVQTHPFEVAIGLPFWCSIITCAIQPRFVLPSLLEKR